MQLAKFVRRPTPANVSRNAQRDRFARSATAPREQRRRWRAPRSPGTRARTSETSARGTRPCCRLPRACSAGSSTARSRARRSRSWRCGPSWRAPRNWPAASEYSAPAAVGFGRVVDGEADPQAVRVVAHAERAADQRKHEQADRAERQNRRDRIRRVLIVGVDRALGRDDRRDAADRAIRSPAG